MSRDFSPRDCLFVNKLFPDLFLSNIKWTLADGTERFVFTEEEMAERKRFSAIAILAGDCFSEIRRILSNDEFAAFNLLLFRLVKADEDKKSLDNFPAPLVSWYRNDKDYYYHEPNDADLLDWLADEGWALLS